MTIYAIGDVQGCNDSLQQLLESLKFDKSIDQLWFTGDLVNRGPASLEVLRFVKSLGDAAVTVLGNHDLHLLAVAYGYAPEKNEDTLSAILQAEDKDELLTWLRGRPLLHYDAKLDLTLVHAGLAPQWDLETARRCAREVEEILSSDNFKKYLKSMYGNKPEKWQDDLAGKERLRFITNCFTRLRYVNEEGKLALKVKNAPGRQPNGYIPWFKSPLRKSTDNLIIFGHWSTLGYYSNDNVLGLDTGCLWGGKLTAVKVNDLAAGKFTPIQLSCMQYQKPGSNKKL